MRKKLDRALFACPFGTPYIGHNLVPVLLPSGALSISGETVKLAASAALFPSAII